MRQSPEKRLQYSGPLSGAIGRIDRFFRYDIWHPGADDLGWPLAPLYRVLRVGQLAIRGIIVNRATFTASALTYTTVLSLVPLLAFAFSVAKGMGAYTRLHEQVIEPFLDNNLGPVNANTPESILSLRDAIDRVLDIVSQTDVSSLGLLGLIILAFAVIRVLSGVEDSFNRIWGVRRARSVVRRVADYISLSVATPLLLVVAVAFTSGAQNSALVALIRDKPTLAPVIDSLFSITPLVAMWLAFTLLYMVMPNTSVHPGSALIGGVVGGTFWQLAQIGHVKFQVGIANYNAIYSSFAAFPIFLVWIYVSWVTVMFGAEFAHAHQGAGRHRQLVNLDLKAPRNRELLALRALALITRRFTTSQKPLRRSELAEKVGAPLAPLTNTLDPLCRDEILVESGDDGDGQWVLVRDPATIHLSDILSSLRSGGSREAHSDAVTRLYDGVLESVRGSSDDPSLVTLAGRAEAEDQDARKSGGDLAETTAEEA